MAYDTAGGKKDAQTHARCGARWPRALLRWYDANARVLPWRVGPAQRKDGARPDPYAVWLSEIMLQQTTVATVGPRFDAFLARWPNIGALAAAPLDDVLGEWAGLGYYARARNLHKCAQMIATDHGGVFPDTEENLKALPGVGKYTAAAIAAIAFDRRAVVVDGNIERVAARLFRLNETGPALKAIVRKRMDEVWPARRSGDFAQGLMDLGALVCRPKNPACDLCPLSEDCAAREAGEAEAYPRRKAKAQKPTRRGAVFALFNARGDILFERRPEKGLLGGMLGLPGTDWTEAAPGDPMAGAPARTRWRKAGEARHTFTHFHLEIDVYVGAAPKRFRRAAGQGWIDPDAARLPTVFKKALAAAQMQD
ncbi:MAG: A/G-specific adenine glycosylase [Pseudomonadota bacterium]